MRYGGTMKASHRAVGRVWLVLWIPVVVGVWACSDGQGGQAYHTVVENASGLERGAPVLLAGVKVGEVRGLTFVQQNKVKVGFVVMAPDAPLPRRDACVAIEPHGLSGAARIALDPGEASSPPLPDGEELAECPSRAARFDEVAEQLGRLIHKLYAGDGVVSRLINDDELATKLERFLERGCCAAGQPDAGAGPDDGGGAD